MKKNILKKLLKEIQKNGFIRTFNNVTFKF